MAREVRVNVVGDTSRLERSLSRVDGRLATTGRNAQRMGSIVAGALAGGAIIRGVGGIVQTFAKYDTALREVGAVSQTSGRELERMGSIARKAGLETGVGATEATKAMAELAKAGLTTAQIGPALRGTLQLAQAGGLGTAEAAEAAANAMSSFGLEASKATAVADAYANAANITTADVGDFALAMSQGSSAAKTAGLTFGETTLALTMLARNAVKGSDAGTSLKSAITQLASPTEKAQNAMARYGLSFFTARGEMKSVAEISGMLNSKLGGLDKQTKLATLTAIAGTDGQRALGAMMGFTRKEAEQLETQLGRQGSAAETAAAKQAGFQGSMNKLRAAAEELGISLGERFAPDIARFADTLTRVAGDPETKDRIVGTFESFVDGGEDLLETLQPIGEVVGGIASAFSSLPDPVKASVVQLGALALIASKLRALGAGAGVAGGVGRLRGELDKVPASSQKAAAAIAKVDAAAARANSRFAMPAVPFADLTGAARQQAVLARRQAAAAERLAAANAPGRGAQALSALGGITGAGGRFASRNRGSLALGAGAGGLGAALSGGDPVSAALTGAAMGSAAGPIGAAAGALVGAGVTAMVGAFNSARKERARKAAERYAKNVTGQVDRALETGLKSDAARRLGRANATLEAGGAATRDFRRGQQLKRSDSFLDRAQGEQLMKQARERASAAGLDINALVKGTSDAYRKAGREAAGAFGDGLKQVRSGSADGLLGLFRAQLGKAPRDAQQLGVNSMVAYARGLEQSGRAPKGTVARLLKLVEREFDLTPKVAGKGRETAREYARGLNDGDAVRDANRAAGRITDAFYGEAGNIPRIAVRSLPGAVATLRTQMDKLAQAARENDPSSILGQKARKHLPELRAEYRRSLSRMAQDMGMSRREANEWATGVSRAARRAKDGSIDVDTLRRRVDGLNGSMRTGEEAARLAGRAFRQMGFDAKDAAALAQTTAVVADAAAAARSLLGPAERRRGGAIRRFSTGGLVPALVSSGEEIEHNGQSMIVPGPRVAADNVAMMLPVGAKVWTDHGQALRAAGVPDDQAMAQQMPHFQRGGKVQQFARGGFVSTAYGPPWNAMNGTGVTRTGVNLKNAPKQYLVAVDPSVIPLKSKLGIWPNPFGYRGKFSAEDTGGAIKGKRIDFYDWRGRASQMKWGRRNVAINTPTSARASRAGGAGGGTEDRTFTETTRRTFGRSPTRGGLLGDAYSAGIEGVNTFGSRAGARQYGNPIVAAIREALDAQRDSYTRTVERTIPGLPAGATSKQTKSFASRLEGTAGGGTKLRRLTAALSTMQRIAAKKLPYTYGGGHGRLGVGSPGFDCSGYVSAGLGAAGWIKSPMATQQGSGLNTLGTSGAGRFLTWGVRGSSGKQAHTMMKIGNSYWESGSGHGPRKVSGWAGKFAYRHMPGYARGGVIGKLGSRAPAPARAAVARYGDAALDPKSPAFVGWGFRNGGGVGRPAFGGLLNLPELSTFAGFRPSAAMNSTLGAVSKSASAENLEAFGAAIEGAALERVDLMRRDLLRRIRRGGDRQAVARLQAAMSIIEADIGGRIAESVAMAARGIESFDQQKAKRAHARAMEGIDEGSSIALSAQLADGESFVRRVAPGAREELSAALQRTKREMRAATTTEAKATLAGQLNEIRGKIAELDQTVLGTEEEIAAARRALPRQLATERTSGIDLADALAGLTAGKDDDRAALAARLQEQQRQVGEAGVAKDNAWLAEAAQGMKSAADALRDFDDAQREEGFALADARASLTETLEDDVRAARAREASVAARLAEAERAGTDPQLIIGLSNEMRAARDATRSLTDQMRQQSRDAAAERAQTLDLRTTLVSMTAGLDDDRQLAGERIAEAERNYADAEAQYRQTYSPADAQAFNEAAQALIAARGSLTDFDRGRTEQALSLKAAEAALTETTADDRQVLLEQQADAQRRLDEARAAGDAGIAEAIRALGDLKGIGDSIKALGSGDQEKDDATKELTEVIKRQNELSERILAGGGISAAAVAAWIAGQASGEIGSRVVRSASTPAYPGGTVRY